jgi:hypothetical protein
VSQCVSSPRPQTGTDPPSQVCTIIPEKRLKVQAEVMAELDQYDNDSLPDVKIFPGPAIQFDVIEYLKPETQSISIVNTGSVRLIISHVD